MAAVYAATHRNGTRAAIKILHAELGVHAHIRSRFFREGRVANTVGHDGAVKVLDEDEDERGSIYLVMELLDGESLDARASRAGGKLPIDEVLAAADQLLDVLIAAHAKGVIQRDLKPENVFLTRDGRVMVLDFGIARLRELSTQSHATRDGTAMGTPAYMAPEQARGLWDEVDARADLWAVGATMFALMTGHPVHDGRTPNEVLVAAVTQKAAPLVTVRLDVPAPVAALVDRALAFQKPEHWPDAKSMQDALRHAYHSMHGEPISSQKLTAKTLETLQRAILQLPFDAPAEAPGQVADYCTPANDTRPLAVGTDGLAADFAAPPQQAEAHRGAQVSGSAWGSNPPGPGFHQTPIGFEDRGPHQRTERFRGESTSQSAKWRLRPPT